MWVSPLCLPFVPFVAVAIGMRAVDVELEREDPEWTVKHGLPARSLHEFVSLLRQDVAESVFVVLVELVHLLFRIRKSIDVAPACNHVLGQIHQNTLIAWSLLCI